MRSMVYSIIFVSVILGIVGWSFLTPPKPQNVTGDPTRGYLVMDKLEWSEDGSSASITIAEVNSTSREIMKVHQVLLEEGRLIRNSTLEHEAVNQNLTIAPDAVFSPDRSSAIIVYYERDLSEGEDPGVHLELMDGENEKDLTWQLRRIVTYAPING